MGLAYMKCKQVGINTVVLESLQLPILLNTKSQIRKWQPHIFWCNFVCVPLFHTNRLKASNRFLQSEEIPSLSVYCGNTNLTNTCRCWGILHQKRKKTKRSSNCNAISKEWIKWNNGKGRSCFWYRSPFAEHINWTIIILKWISSEILQTTDNLVYEKSDYTPKRIWTRIWIMDEPKTQRAVKPKESLIRFVYTHDTREAFNCDNRCTSLEAVGTCQEWSRTQYLTGLRQYLAGLWLNQSDFAKNVESKGLCGSRCTNFNHNLPNTSKFWNVDSILFLRKKCDTLCYLHRQSIALDNINAIKDLFI